MDVTLVKVNVATGGAIHIVSLYNPPGGSLVRMPFGSHFSGDVRDSEGLS